MSGADAVVLGEAVDLGGAPVAAQPVHNPRSVIEAVGARDLAGPPEHPEAVVGAAAEHDRRGLGGQAPGLQQAGHTDQPREPRTTIFDARRRLRDALSLLPARNATTDGVQRAHALALQVAELLREEVEARARDTAQRRAGYDPDAVLLDKLGRVRSPATIPGYMAGRPAPSKGRRYPPNPFTVDEIVRLLNHVGDVTKNDVYAERLRAIILVLWRSGVRISEGLNLAEDDLKPQTSEIYVRRGKGGKPRSVGVDAWLWLVLRPWEEMRARLPPGPYFCVIEGKTAGVDAWGASQVREKFADLQAAAGIRKRFRPHQLRHTMTCELILEGKNIVIVQRQLGHANLAVRTNYTNGLPQSQVIDAMRGRDMPVLPAFGS